MSLILDGTNGVSDIDGSAATPALRGSDANTGIFFPAADTIAFAEGGVEAMRIDSSGNVGIGTSSPGAKLDVRTSLSATTGVQNIADFYPITSGSTDETYGGRIRLYTKNLNGNYWPAAIAAINDAGGSNLSSLGLYTAAGGATLVERARIDSSGNLLVGTTDASFNTRMTVAQPTSSVNVLSLWNSATTGDNQFVQFFTEGNGAGRGSITYNRSAGLVAYNTTSDYRAKDIYGAIADSGSVIDSVPVYMGKMKGATQERPMFIAHEVPAYAHTGVKDAVDADENPIYQQMDASALIPVMWAEIQSLRKRITALESAP